MAAMAVHDADGAIAGTVHDGHDVFGIPHGGYLAGLATNAALLASGQPDVFTITTHFLRKGELGPIRFDATVVGGSRRFTTVALTATQGGETVLHTIASTGDRTGIEGPEWSSGAPQPLQEDMLSPYVEDFPPDVPFTPPRIAERARLRLDASSVGFLNGRADGGWLRTRMDTEVLDQAMLVLATDVTPPAVFNSLGPTGWVPTVELTAHVRVRQALGPARIDVITNHVSGGFLEEDALVYAADGSLAAQSRQLARAPKGG